MIEIQNLTKCFRDRKAVDQLSFTVEAGEIFGFLGPNGAGKSTTIRCMVALLKPDAGDVLLLGKSVRRQRNAALAQVGALIERPDFYPNLTARQNLMMLARMERIDAGEVNRVLEIVGLQARARDRVKTYSHGMKQRLGIAQALLGRPRLLILDEPTNGLDPQGMKEIRELVKSLAGEGMTIFLSSHLLDEVQKMCTSMAILHRGRLVTAGKVEDVMQEVEGHVVELEVTPLDRALEILSRLEICRSVEKAETRIRLQVNSEDIPRLVADLVRAGIQVQAVVPRRSLEDVFLRLTEEAA